MSDEGHGGGKPPLRYINGAGVSNEEVMQVMQRVEHKLDELREELREPMNRTAINTDRIANSIEGLIDKATDKWRVPLPAFLMVTGTFAVVFVLFVVVITNTKLDLSHTGIHASPQGAAHAPAEKRQDPHGP